MTSVLDKDVTLVPIVLSPDADEAHSVDAACLALRVVSGYAGLTGASRTSPVRTLLIDLVADLMHLATQSGISFEAVLAEASAVVDGECPVNH